MYSININGVLELLYETDSESDRQKHATDSESERLGRDRSQHDGEEGGKGGWQ